MKHKLIVSIFIKLYCCKKKTIEIQSPCLSKLIPYINKIFITKIAKVSIKMVFITFTIF